MTVFQMWEVRRMTSVVCAPQDSSTSSQTQAAMVSDLVFSPGVDVRQHFEAAVSECT